MATAPRLTHSVQRSLRRLAVSCALLWCLAGGSAVTEPQRVNDDQLLTKGRAGHIEVGMSVDDALHRLSSERIRLVDLKLEGLFTPAVEIYSPDSNELLLVIEIREFPCRTFYVSRVRVFDPELRTADGVGVGSTIGSLQKYRIESRQDEGPSVFLPDLQMSFRSSSPALSETSVISEILVLLSSDDLRKRACPGV